MIEAPPEIAQETERTQSYVIFQLGGEGYALEVSRVQEVIDTGPMTHVPGGPSWLKGVINLRGHVVPVWDLRLPFELLIDPKPSRAPCVLMVETMVGTELRVLGLIVDRVSDVLDFAPEEVQPSPPLGLGKASPFVRGLIRHQEGFLLVLDVDRVFIALAGSLTGGGF
ncbi:MAG: chemotaxis protein CheW [Isosphaeraceae bacterium]|nr:chemotaxis protein CheW [Isosphaeraceae bacterium]